MRNEFEVLECRYLYGCLLNELAESTNSEPGLFHEAEEELKKLWQTRNTPRLKRFKMLKAGRNLVSTLAISHKISDAQGVLSEAQEFEEQGSEENSPESLAFYRSLGISLMRTKNSKWHRSCLKKCGQRAEGHRIRLQFSKMVTI
jgi:hypothetical protein